METPELDKMSAVQDKAFVLSEFLDYLTERRIHLAEYERDRLFTIDVSNEQLLADFFEIDLKKVEKERRMLIEHISKLNEENS